MRRILLTVLLIMCLSLPVYAFRMAAGETNQYVHFIAVDSADFHTRETGFSAFTVVYSIAGGADTTMTTPTIAEIDAVTMPGVYNLLIDEEGMTTLTAGDDTAELCLHITHSGMDPVTRVIEIYRPETTLGETLTVGSGIGSADMIAVSGDTTAADNVEDVMDETGIAANLKEIYVTDYAANYNTTLDRWIVDVNTVCGAAPISFANGATEIQTDASGYVKVSDGTGTGQIDTDTGTVLLRSATEGQIDAIETDTGTTLPAQITGVSTELAETDANLALVLADTGELQTNQGAWATATGFSTSGQVTTLQTTADGIDANSALILADTELWDTSGEARILLTGQDLPLSTALYSTTISDVNSTTIFNLTSGPPDDDALNGAIAVLQDASDPLQKAISSILDYKADGFQITLANAPVFTVAATDNIIIIPLPEITAVVELTEEHLVTLSGYVGDAVWDEAAGDHETANTFGEYMKRLLDMLF